MESSKQEGTSMRPFFLERYFAKHEFVVKYLLSSSDPESVTVPELMALASTEEKSMYDNLSLGYTESQGHPLLLREIASMYQGVEPQQVLVVTPEEGIYIAISSLVKKGDTVIVSSPAYQSLYEVALGKGCNLVKWDLTTTISPDPKSEGGLSWDFDAQLGVLEEKLKKENPSLLIFNFPHNPTGLKPSPEQFKQLISLAEKNKVRIFCDEMYRYLEYDSYDRLPSAVELSEDALCLCGLSKSFGMPGLRIGWIICKNADILRKLQDYKDYTTICSSAPSEILAIIALRHKKEILLRNLKIITENLSTLKGFLKNHSDKFRCVMPSSGMILFLEIIPKWLSASMLSDDIREKKSVMLLPSTVYEHGDRHVRMGFGRKNMKEALVNFESYLTESFPLLQSKHQK